MILRSIVSALRTQNWTAVTIELIIVVIGVFIGTQVANWNQARLEKAATERMLVQLVPELQFQVDYFDHSRTYYATARRFADQALAAWRGDRRLSDEQFVIAAYQASQIIGIGVNAQNWTLTFGGEQLRNIADPQVRRNLEFVLTQDYSPVQFEAVATPYREQVRRVIPIHIQDLIRRDCGDRQIKNTFLTHLPPVCSLRLPPAEAKATAAALRARRDLPGELNWHLAAVAVYQANADILEQPIRALHRDLSNS
ncbi:hypothetical protein [Sphingomonas sp.]|uniref:hypothetical protein n=1 Tax=Sphingomonas sp. TaxID=28214 RepID=UPI0017AD0FBB|nr:hypothetical protein [Sphingomonas sp.]MBA3511214.1 hypothetical protein [Sphingomonas sp.]